MGYVITIDGPAASGKTSVSRELASRLGCSWVSTGAFYRGLGYVALESSIDLKDEKKLAELAASNVWKVQMDNDSTKVFFNNNDVTDLIAHEDVGSVASVISHYPLVRKSLLEAQRNCQAVSDGLVAEGRDCGTVVFPDAEVKIYLTARSEDRAQRRASELGLDHMETIKAQKVRDEQDTTRKAAPLQVPANAYFVDTTQLSFDEVVNLLELHVKKHINS